MKLFFNGTEIPTYRNLLQAEGIKDVSLSYFGLRRRTKFTRPWKLEDKFDASANIFIDSGCYTINSAKEQKYSNEELEDIRSHYYRWVHSNIERVEYYTEFDANQLGGQSREETRDNLRDIFFDKFVPLWSASDGLQTLYDLSEQFGRVGILQTSIGGRDLVPTLNSLASRGVQLFGLSMTKPDIMAAVPWYSVASTSWLSPSQFGDTIVWSHNQLKRYPKKMKDQARKKERSVFMTNGFDVEKIEKDDSTELLRLSVWSWSQQVNAINRRSSTGVTSPVIFDDDDNSEVEEDTVGGVLEKAQKRVPTATPRDPSQRRVIPFLDFDFDKEKRKNPETGEYEDVDVPKVKIRSSSMRICDTCFLATKCPMFEPGSTCAYDIPIVIRTKEQMTALMDSMVEMQAQRVIFMKMAEDAEGGYADPNLSSEIDRLGNLMKKKHDMEQEGFSLTVTAKQSGQISMVDRIFGDIGNTQKLHELEAPQRADNYIEEIVDAEFLDR
jgi:hypothetical protein